jgi:hypothetical protein
MSSPDSSTFLRNVLLLDAATCAFQGALTTFGSGLVAQLTALPPALLIYAGASLFPIAIFMAVVATRATLPVPGVWLVILGNVGWVIASVALLVGGWVAPNALGLVFVLGQAAAVAGLSALEYVGLQRLAPAAA